MGWVVVVEGGAPTARLGLVLKALRAVSLGVNAYDDDSDARYAALMEQVG
ncbi:MAG: hypothetical protein LBR32_06015 [Propionibacteriaceae bacterium]|jgi:hypothetical protein|nr:hypothetical protein [Propionibacteriaceae bacterium]